MPSLHSTTSTAFFFLIFSLHSLTGGPSRPSHIQLLFFCHRCRPFSFGKFQCAFRKAVKERCCFFSFLLCVYASAVTGGDKVRFPPPPLHSSFRHWEPKTKIIGGMMQAPSIRFGYANGMEFVLHW